MDSVNQGTTGNQPHQTSISKICDKHGEYISDIKKVGTGKFERTFESDCPLCEQEQIKKKLQDEAVQFENYIEARICDVNVPLRYRGYDLESGNIVGKNEKQQLIIERCLKYIRNFDSLKKTGTSLIFTGSPGTGKTLIVLSMIRPLITKLSEKDFNPNNLYPMSKTDQCIYINIYDLFASIKATYKKDSQETELMIIKKYISTDLLIIDEVGAQSASEYETLTLFRIINARYENLKPTILISNLSEKDLSAYIGERTIDRFRENHGAVFVFDWESSRGNK
jgi:DNA replication protein DnaC